MKVRIKDWYELEEEFGLDEYGDIKCYCGFVKDMKQYCGKVIEIDKDTFIKDMFTYDDWVFTDDMYEIVEE